MTLPDPALVVLVGASGSGKSTWAEARYRREEIVSSDACRGMVADDENDQNVNTEAFELLRRASQRASVKVHVLAEQIVETIAASKKGDNVTPISLAARRPWPV